MSKHNKQKEVSFSQLMRSVDDTIHTEPSEPVTPNTETPVQADTTTTNVVADTTTTTVTNPPLTTAVKNNPTTEVSNESVLQKDKDGFTVEKTHTDNIAKTITEATAEATATKRSQKLDNTQTPEVENITKKIEAYLNFNTGLIMQDQEKKQKAGELFRDILFYATDHPVKEVLDVVYRFFKKHRDKVLAPEIALPATLHFKRDVTERISCIYTLFRGLVEEKPFKLNMATTRVLLHMPDNNKIDSLLTYFEAKQK